MSNRLKDLDFVGAGFHRLDPDLIVSHPPKINWGKLYLNKSDEERLAFAEKLAASMNHAAFMIQKERDKLNDLITLKERQVKNVQAALDQNNKLLQERLDGMNVERHEFTKTIAGLKAKIRELEGGNKR